MTKLRPRIELVPKPLWWKTLYRLLPRPVWDKLRRQVYQQARYRCEICGATDQTLYCHEKWAYDDVAHVARINGFEALCHLCHLSHHPGYAGVSGQSGGLPEHFRSVNACDEQTYLRHSEEAWEQWRIRSSWTDWTIDFGVWSKYIPTETPRVPESVAGPRQDGAGHRLRAGGGHVEPL
jgi:hypothetical protein